LGFFYSSGQEDRRVLAAVQQFPPPVPDTYPLPSMMDFSARVTECKKFSKIDFKKGYFQNFMHPDDISKTMQLHKGADC
jgi:hypothetical protein